MTHAHGDHSHDHHGDGPAGIGAGEAIWDERYRSRESLWSGNPNPQLLSEASNLRPARALDVGCGEGADAIWLAENGWHVTAVDISSVALERGAAQAREAGAGVAKRITWLHADLTTWAPEPQSFELVSIQFMHLPKDQREPMYQRLAESVAPDGTLLVVGHHPSDMQTTIPRPAERGFYFTGDDLTAVLDPHDWEIVVNATRERNASDPEGKIIAIHDTVLRARRRL